MSCRHGIERLRDKIIPKEYVMSAIGEIPGQIEYLEKWDREQETLAAVEKQKKEDISADWPGIVGIEEINDIRNIVDGRSSSWDDAR